MLSRARKVWKNKSVQLLMLVKIVRLRLLKGAQMTTDYVELCVWAPFCQAQNSVFQIKPKFRSFLWKTVLWPHFQDIGIKIFTNYLRTFV